MNAYINTDTHTHIYMYISMSIYTYIYIYPYRYIQTTNNINLWQIYFKRGLLSLLMLFFAHCGRCRSNYGQMGGSSGQLWGRDLGMCGRSVESKVGKNLGKIRWSLENMGENIWNTSEILVISSDWWIPTFKNMGKDGDKWSPTLTNVKNGRQVAKLENNWW
jgi:hypothetical protein